MSRTTEVSTYKAYPATWWGPCAFFARPILSALTVFKERNTRYLGIQQTYQIDDPSKLVIKSDIDDVTRFDHGPNVMMVTG